MYCLALHCIALHCIVIAIALHRMVLYGIIWCGMYSTYLHICTHIYAHMYTHTYGTIREPSWTIKTSILGCQFFLSFVMVSLASKAMSVRNPMMTTQDTTKRAGWQSARTATSSPRREESCHRSSFCFVQSFVTGWYYLQLLSWAAEDNSSVLWSNKLLLGC